jgi:hypothetical protein
MRRREDEKVSKVKEYIHKKLIGFNDHLINYRTRFEEYLQNNPDLQ